MTSISNTACTAVGVLRWVRAADGMQGFKQRFYNYLHFLLVRVIMMGGSSLHERELTKRYGYIADGSWTSKSTAAAYIAVGDWALEYPFPVPPKVHVTFSNQTCSLTPR